MQKEVRNSDGVLTSTNDRTVEGYAIVFNRYSKNLGGFVEIIESTAADGIIEASDILCLLNHNEDKGVLARSKYGTGSLKLEIDDYGVKYTFDAPNTSLGDELLEGIKRGDISTSSFAFTVKEQEVVRNQGELPVRIIKKFAELYDVSPVYKEAYPDTSIGKRSIDEALQEQEQKQENELRIYFESFDKRIQELSK